MCRSRVDQRTPIVLDSSKSTRDTWSTRSGGQSAVSRVPGRLRFMMTGVRKTSTAPSRSSRSMRGSYSWGDMSSMVVSICVMVSAPTAATGAASPTKQRSTLAVPGRSRVPAP
jgi:hypothetical protein